MPCWSGTEIRPHPDAASFSVARLDNAPGYCISAFLRAFGRCRLVRSHRAPRSAPRAAAWSHALARTGQHDDGRRAARTHSRARRRSRAARRCSCSSADVHVDVRERALGRQRIGLGHQDVDADRRRRVGVDLDASAARAACAARAMAEIAARLLSSISTIVTGVDPDRARRQPLQRVEPRLLQRQRARADRARARSRSPATIAAPTRRSLAVRSAASPARVPVTRSVPARRRRPTRAAARRCA